MSTHGKEHKSPADALAAILGSGAFATGKTVKTAAGKATAEKTAADDESGDEGDAPPQPEATDGEQPAEAAAEPEPEAEKPPPRLRRERRRAAPANAARRGRMGRIFGLLCLGGGVVLTVLAGQGRVPALLTAWGLDASVLLALGSIAYVLGAMQRQTALGQVRFDTLGYEQQEGQLDMQASLAWLVEQQQQHLNRPPAEGEELAQVLLALERQDEKVSNLSRAMKMYGKPMSEIANQGADVAAQVSQLRSNLESVVESLQQGLQRLEAATRGKAIDLGPLERQGAETAQDLKRTLTAFGERLPDKGALQQQLVRVEASVQAVSQRLEDSDVRKSLLRLEEVAKQHGKKLDELAPAATLTQETHKLERQLDSSVGKLGNALDQLRSKDVAGLENTVREIQREISGLATAVAYVQQAVKTGLRAAPAAPAPSAPAPAAPAMAPAATPSAPTSGAAVVAAAIARDAAAAASKPSIDTTGLDDAQAGVAQNKTGARASTGKNVLGAIAKLKQMKG
jgi:hypothetical protein